MIGNTIELLLFCFLTCRFLNPENTILQKFDVAVWFWSTFLLLMSIWCLLIVLWSDETRNKFREKMKKSVIFGYLLSIGVCCMLILTDFRFCSLCYMLYIFIGFIIRKYIKEEV